MLLLSLAETKFARESEKATTIITAKWSRKRRREKKEKGWNGEGEERRGEEAKKKKVFLMDLFLRQTIRISIVYPKLVTYCAGWKKLQHSKNVWFSSFFAISKFDICSIFVINAASYRYCIICGSCNKLACAASEWTTSKRKRERERELTTTKNKRYKWKMLAYFLRMNHI